MKKKECYVLEGVSLIKDFEFVDKAIYKDTDRYILRFIEISTDDKNICVAGTDGKRLHCVKFDKSKEIILPPCGTYSFGVLHNERCLIKEPNIDYPDWRNTYPKKLKNYGYYSFDRGQTSHLHAKIFETTKTCVDYEFLKDANFNGVEIFGDIENKDYVSPILIKSGNREALIMPLSYNYYN
jgi:hypothetical protein